MEIQKKMTHCQWPLGKIFKDIFFANDSQLVIVCKPQQLKIKAVNSGSVLTSSFRTVFICLYILILMFHILCALETVE